MDARETRSFPELDEPLPDFPEAVPEPPAPPPTKSSAFALIFGVILPVAAVLVEFTTRMCASTFFDPLPTLGHILLYLFIPASVGFVLWVQRRGIARWIRWAAIANGMAIASATLFTIKFLPILPMSIFAVLLMGIGLCGLSPLLALIVTVRCRGYLTPLAPRLPGWWSGILLGILLVGAIEGPTALTMWGMEMAASGDPATSRRGIRLLRTVGNRDLMLRACYDSVDESWGARSRVPREQFAQQRAIYYRVTGIPFNLAPRPNTLLFGSDTDWNVGDNTVAGHAMGLSLATSRMDGSLDADAALGYLEWTMTFKNTNTLNQEARAQIALPPGAVVSRATLWVNGQEREAAFAALGHARAAYQEVAVVQQRDPLLVTTCGPDRLLVQCFPVPAGGEMKIRLGITTPLLPDGRKAALLPLPRMVERNFAMNDEQQHAVWLEATSPLQGIQDLKAETAPNAFALRGNLTDAALATPVRVTRNPAVTRSWTPDPARPGQIIRQQLVEASTTTPSRLIVVIDGSTGMGSYAALAHRIGSLRGVECAVLLAGDDVTTLVPLAPISGSFSEELSKSLRRPFRGGMNNVPALERAWDLAAKKPDGAILWMHGPQPVEEDATALLQRWERRPDGPRLYAMQVIPGANEILKSLDGLAAVQAVPFVGTPEASLARLLAQWKPGGTRLVMQRERVPAANSEGKRTSSHLARLWARDGAMRLYHRNNLKDTEMAIAMAAQYKLVTPVTGAVVLETTEQYKRHDLEPAKPGTTEVPVVPEPEEWLLMGMAALLLLTLWWRGRTSCQVRQAC